MTIVHHIEHYIGPITEGWRSEGVKDFSLQVALFENTPDENTNTFISLGLSHPVFEISDEKVYRLEIIFSISSEYDAETYGSVLLAICETILRHRQPVLHGHIIPLSKELAKEVGFDAVYCTNQTSFDEGLNVYEGSKPATVIVAALPIFQNEVDYIEKNGWSIFEKLMNARNLNMLSIDREPIV